MNRIILALDTTNLEEAINITQKIKNKIFTIKIGLELWNSFGKEGIKKFNEIGVTNLMLDLKLKDIPQTVYKAKQHKLFLILTIGMISPMNLTIIQKPPVHVTITTIIVIVIVMMETIIQIFNVSLVLNNIVNSTEYFLHFVWQEE